MSDLLFKTDEGVFSYRVAGVCVHDGCVLLQSTSNDPSLAFPGGHVAFGETNGETLAREFAEEMGAEIKVHGLRWAAEVFFPWGERRCHQICLYYDVEIVGGIPMRGSFVGREQIGGRKFELMFRWVPIEKLGGEGFVVYPTQCAELLKNGGGDVAHFVYRED